MATWCRPSSLHHSNSSSKEARAGALATSLSAWHSQSWVKLIKLPSHSHTLPLPPMVVVVVVVAMVLAPADLNPMLSMAIQVPMEAKDLCNLSDFRGSVSQATYVVRAQVFDTLFVPHCAI